MNKLTKLLTFVGLSSAVAYVALNLKGKTNPNSSQSLKSSKQSDPQKSNSNRSRNQNGKTKHITDYSDARTQKMYKDLGMTDEQKRKYERDYKTVMDTWQNKNANYNMGEQQQIDEHNSVLNAVLNEDQFGMYRDWFKNNPA